MSPLSSFSWERCSDLYRRRKKTVEKGKNKERDTVLVGRVEDEVINDLPTLAGPSTSNEKKRGASTDKTR